MASWSYPASQINLTAAHSINLQSYVENSEWVMVSATLETKQTYYITSGAHWSEVDIVIVIQRRSLFYIMNMIVPCSLLIMVGLLAFYIPAGSGDKIALSTTILLTMALFQLMITEKFPPTSDVIPLLSEYYV